MVHFPTHCPHHIAPIETPPPSLPHLRYVISEQDNQERDERQVGRLDDWGRGDRRWCCEGAVQKVGEWMGVGSVKQLSSANCKECMDEKEIWMVLKNEMKTLINYVLKILILNWWLQIKLSIINYFQLKFRLHGTRQLHMCNHGCGEQTVHCAVWVVCREDVNNFNNGTI